MTHVVGLRFGWRVRYVRGTIKKNPEVTCASISQNSGPVPSEAVQMKKIDVCQNRLLRNPKQQKQASRSMFQMNFLICAEIGCVKIWVCPSPSISDTADTDMQLYFERKNGMQKDKDCTFYPVHVPCGRNCVGCCEFRCFLAEK